MTTITSTLNTLGTALTRQADRVSKDAQALQQTFVAAQNALDNVSVSSAAASASVVEDAMQSAVIPPEGDVSAAVVDILQARFAYAADTTAARVTADVARDAVNVLGRKES